MKYCVRVKQNSDKKGKRRERHIQCFSPVIRRDDFRYIRTPDAQFESAAEISSITTRVALLYSHHVTKTLSTPSYMDTILYCYMLQSFRLGINFMLWQ